MNIAIVLGGGDGTRAGGTIPKQFQLLDGTPILLRSIRAMILGGANKIYVVVHPEFLREWEEILETEPCNTSLVCGGSSRWHSVKNALLAIDEDGFSTTDIIAVHDGARPLVPEAIVKNGWREATRFNVAVPAIPVTDSLRQIDKHDHNQSIAVDRNLYRAVQTPQLFRADILMQAYSQPQLPTFTDDASVVESIGQNIHLFPGSPINIKITNPSDFAIADTLLKLK